MDASDICAEGAEFFDDTFVAAVDVIDALDCGFAAGDQCGEHQTGAGAKVGSLDSRAAEFRGTVDNSTVAVYGDVGAHPLHFAVRAGNDFQK